MKHLLTIISLLLLFSSCEGQDQNRISDKKIKTEYYEYYSKPGLNAKVKHIEDLKFEKSEERQYDLHGNIIKKIYSSEVTIVYLYDDEQNLLREETYDSEEKLIVEKIYERNNKNKSLITAQIQIRNNDTTSNERNIYDKNGHLILSEFIKNSVWTKAFAYEYDEKGRKVLQYDYIMERYGGHPKVLYEYDEFDNVIITKQLDSNNTLIRSEHYKYDERNNKIEYLLISEPDQTVTDKKITTYDRFDNIISINRNGKNEQEYKYKYNEYGDWIEKTFYYHGYVDTYVKRKIEYQK